jgi:hypothetical protein
MRSFRLHLRRTFASPRAARVLRASLEVLGWILAVGLLEYLGGTARVGDVFDLGLLIVAAGPLVALAVLGAASGRLPFTRAAFAAAGSALRRGVRALDPRYHVALRLPEHARTLPDRPLLVLLAVLGAALAAVVAFGPSVLLVGLMAVKDGLAYTPYLLLLSALWFVMLALVTLALVLESHALRARGRRPAALLGVAGLVASALLPGGVFVAAILLLGLWQAVRMARRPLPLYLFCRRDRRGRLRSVSAQTFLRRLHLACVLLLALATALGNAARLFDADRVDGTFAFTGSLGLLAAVAALVLTARANTEFGRLLALRGVPPETPLQPTVWWSAPSATRRSPAAVVLAPSLADLPTPPPTLAEAREEGWAILTGPQPPSDAYDLVAGPGVSGPRALRLHPELPRADRSFRRLRRFHVVHRREFFRRFRSVVKEARPQRRRGGTGFLFCPHVWLVPSLLRDGEKGASGVGRPFAQVFSSRLRRYLGGFLRDIGVDVVYWEDAVTWADLRRVLGVAFECWDQHRTPVRERHFVGIPRVRVVLHEENTAEATEPPTRPTGWRPPVAAGARILVVLRDRGGESVRPRASAPSDRRPQPVSL